MDLNKEFTRRLAAIHELDKDEVITAEENSIDIRNEEFQAMADVFLGEDYDKQKIRKVDDLQIYLHKQQARLCQYHDAGKLSSEVYVRSFNSLLSDVFKKCEAILGQEDFIKMFGGPPSEVGGFIDEEVFFADQDGHKPPSL
jgi:hypothetical protein